MIDTRSSAKGSRRQFASRTSTRSPAWDQPDREVPWLRTLPSWHAGCGGKSAWAVSQASIAGRAGRTSIPGIGRTRSDRQRRGFGVVTFASCPPSGSGCRIQGGSAYNALPTGSAEGTTEGEPTWHLNEGLGLVSKCRSSGGGPWPVSKCRSSGVGSGPGNGVGSGSRSSATTATWCSGPSCPISTPIKTSSCRGGRHAQDPG